MDQGSRRRPQSEAVMELEAKRRRLRKGTHSCWECKRRKMKCTMSSNIGSCEACRRRGSHCVSQEYPDEGAGDIRDDCSTPPNGHNDTPCDAVRGLATPVSIDHDLDSSSRVSPQHHQPSHAAQSHTSRSQTGTGVLGSPHNASNRDSRPSGTGQLPSSKREYERLSRSLHASLPSQEESDRICRASSHPSILPHDIMIVPYGDIDQSGRKTLDALAQMPLPDAHPAIIARHMLLLASVIQHLHPRHHREIEGLSEAPRVMMARLADLAITHVTNKDSLTDSMEGLECVIIESVYQANLGNLRRSWLACRRAMSIAQLMRLNRPDPQMHCQALQASGTQQHPQLIWYRIVFLDRLLCLMLGLSQGSHDRSMATDTILSKETPVGRLERIHCVIACRILERDQTVSAGSEADTLTRTLDQELQRAAKELPSKWWLVPTLKVASDDKASMFWDTRRLFAQILHYNLLNQLHLPHLLRFSSTDNDRQHEYSRTTCINASREILSRVITLRGFNGIAYHCAIVDFLVLMAAMTLLLAHLNSHQSETGHLLSHQYYSDRALIEQVQEIMEEVHLVHADALSAQTADLVRRLLKLDAEAEGLAASRVSVLDTTRAHDPSGTDENIDGAVDVCIPYFGVIRIAREGISMKSSTSRSDSARVRTPRTPSSMVDHVGTTSPEPCHPGASEPITLHPGPVRLGPADSQVMSSPVYTCSNEGHRPPIVPTISSNVPMQTGTLPHSDSAANHLYCNPTPQMPPRNSLYSDPWQSGGYPGLAAGAEDWAFQGTDWAFFDTLTRNDGFGTNQGLDWTLNPAGTSL